MSQATLRGNGSGRRTSQGESPCYGKKLGVVWGPARKSLWLSKPREKVVEECCGGNGGQIMWGLAGHDADLGFFQKWEGKPVEAAGTEVGWRSGLGSQNVRVGVLALLFVSCVILACPSSASLPHWWNVESHGTLPYKVVRIQLILSKELVLGG